MVDRSMNSKGVVMDQIARNVVSISVFPRTRYSTASDRHPVRGNTPINIPWKKKTDQQKKWTLATEGIDRRNEEDETKKEAKREIRFANFFNWQKLFNKLIMQIPICFHPSIHPIIIIWRHITDTEIICVGRFALYYCTSNTKEIRKFLSSEQITDGMSHSRN